jgi:DNA-binding response OmpR family regulator
MTSEKKKILIVEDDKYYRVAYKDGLEDAGFIVDMAEDGQLGLEKIRSDKPDMILLDLLMPEVGGFDVLEELKDDKVLNKIPVIVLSNLGQDSDVEKSKTLGAVDFIIKSNLTMKEVIARVKHVLGD